jgi:hypothetical protein
MMIWRRPPLWAAGASAGAAGAAAAAAGVAVASAAAAGAASAGAAGAAAGGVAQAATIRVIGNRSASLRKVDFIGKFLCLLMSYRLVSAGGMGCCDQLYRQCRRGMILVERCS